MEATMIGWQVKAIAGLAVIAALAFAGWRINEWRQGYQQREAAERALTMERQGRVDDMKEVRRRLEEDAAARMEYLARLDGIEKRFKDLKIPDPKVLVHTREVPGACPVSGVSDEFVRLYNQAAAP